MKPPPPPPPGKAKTNAVAAQTGINFVSSSNATNVTTFLNQQQQLQQHLQQQQQQQQSDMDNLERLTSKTCTMTGKTTKNNDTNKAEKSSSSPSSAMAMAITTLENQFEFYHAWTPNNLDSSLETRSVIVSDHSITNDNTDGDIDDGDDNLNDGDDDNDDVETQVHHNATTTLRLKGLPPYMDSDTLKDFFSAFGTVADATVVVVEQNEDGDDDDYANNNTPKLQSSPSTLVSTSMGYVTFEEGSTGAQKTMDAQPIQMFGRRLEISIVAASAAATSSSVMARNVTNSLTKTIPNASNSNEKSSSSTPNKSGWRSGYAASKKAFSRATNWSHIVGTQQHHQQGHYHNCQSNPSTSAAAAAAAANHPFPIMVAPPNYGPWCQPPCPSTYLRRNNNNNGKSSSTASSTTTTTSSFSRTRNNTYSGTSTSSSSSFTPNTNIIATTNNNNSTTTPPGRRAMGTISTIAKKTILATKMASTKLEKEVVVTRSSSAPSSINHSSSSFQNSGRESYDDDGDDYDYFQQDEKLLQSNHRTHQHHHNHHPYHHSQSVNDTDPPKRPSPLRSLLSKSVHNPLFDDDDDDDEENNDRYDTHCLEQLRSASSMGDTKSDLGTNNESVRIRRFHTDNALTSWVWAPQPPPPVDDDSRSTSSVNYPQHSPSEQSESGKEMEIPLETDNNHNGNAKTTDQNQRQRPSNAEWELSCALVRGRAVNAKLPLLATVSTRKEKRDDDSPCEKNNDDGAEEMQQNGSKGTLDPCWNDTNLHLLHKAIKVTVKRRDEDDSSSRKGTIDTGCSGQAPSKDGPYTLYQARHPCLAPLISVSIDQSNNTSSSNQSSITSVFDITPSRVRPLHEWLRTMDSDEYLNKPLFPGIDGHVLEPLGDEMTHLPQNTHPTQQQNGGPDQLGQCSCRKTPNRGISLKFSRQKRQKRRFRVGTAYRADVVDLRIRFLALQLFHAVNFCHSRGITLGDHLRPDKIFVQDDGWIRLVVPIVHKVEVMEKQRDDSVHGSDPTKIIDDVIEAQSTDGTSVANHVDYSDAANDNILPQGDRRSIFHKYDDNSSKGQENVTMIPYPGYGDVPLVQWQKGQLTNLAYLMMLNAAAGRTVGDPSCPPILPWVTDFTSKIDLDSETHTLGRPDRSPWRDLSKSKFRLKKGDEQLDHTFLHADPAHHVPETISDLTYTMYRARSLPIHQLRSSVRDTFVPQHYPNSLEKLYEWTPDEATFEFYVHDANPSIFHSRHAEMPDLSVPVWCRNDQEQFISYHRSLLESDFVSRHLHLWIDLNFGDALSGERAVAEKNVVLHRISWDGANENDCNGDCHSSLADPLSDRNNNFRKGFRKSVFVQLFSRPHPKKHSNLRKKISTALHTALDDYHGQEMVQIDVENQSNHHEVDGPNDFELRIQRDVSMIGAIIKDCYHATYVVPPPDVVVAINDLTFGRLVLKQSLRNSVPGDTNGYPFPKHCHSTYEYLAMTQSLTFQRDESNSTYVDNNDLTVRSSDLERQLTIIRSSKVLSTIPSSMAGLVAPSFLSLLCSVDIFIENFRTDHPYSLFADKMCDFLITLSERVPAELIIPHVLRFLDAAFNHATNSLSVTEALGKLYLSDSLFSALYSHSCGEYCIVWLASFITMQLCRCKSSPASLKQDRLQITSVVVFFTSLLAQDCLVGSSICCRYFIPGFVLNIPSCASINQPNPVVQALKSLLPFLPQDAIGVLVCKPILRIIFPTHLPYFCAVKGDPLGSQSNDEDIPETYRFLNESVALLRMCLRCMNSDNIIKYYLQSNSGTILQTLLASFEVEIARYTLATIPSKTSERSNVTCHEHNMTSTLLQETCFLLCDMIASINAEDLIQISPIVETYCSRVNDEYSTLAMNQFKDNVFDRERAMSLPGVGTAVLLSSEMLKACGSKELLKVNCPSALELLVWVNSPEKLVGHKGTPTPLPTPMQVPAEHQPPVNPDKVTPPNQGDLTLSDSIAAIPLDEEKEGPSIEMLAPKWQSDSNLTLSEDDSDGDLEENSTNARQHSRSSDSLFNILQKDQPNESHFDHKNSNDLLPASSNECNDQAKRRRELAWLLGLNRRDKESRINYLWQPRMMISTTLCQDEINGEDAASITCMVANKPESMLVAGNSHGEVLLFDLRRQPPSLKCRNQFVNDRDTMGKRLSIRQVDFFDREASLLVCNKGLHHWDIETETTITSLTRKNSVLNTLAHGNNSWHGADFVGFSIFPKGTGTLEIHSGASCEIAAISHSHVYTIDLRSSNSMTHNHHLTQPNNDYHFNTTTFDPMVKSLTWYRESLAREDYLKNYKTHRSMGSKTEPPSFHLTCITTHCGGGDWICVGSSSGHVHCFDRRQGKLLVCWKAHSKSIEYLKAVSRHRLISASGDKTAVLWDLSQTPPLKISRIYNIPGKEQSMNIISHKFRYDGLVSIPDGDLLLCAISGRKAVFQPMPQSSNNVATLFPENESFADVKAERIVMCDYEGSRVSSSGKLRINSIALLPCRQLVLLGCEGEIHVCL